MKPFRDLRDWKEQYKLQSSTQVRIGMLHSLFSGGEDGEFDQELKWGDDSPKIAESLLWAATNVHLEKKVTKKVIQMLVRNIYSNVYFIRGMDDQLVATLRLLRVVLSKDSDLSMDDQLSKQVNEFLRAVVTEFKPDNSYRVMEVVKTVCDFHLPFLFIHSEWIGNEVVIRELKSRIYSDIPFSTQLRGSRVEEVARNLAIHLAAKGELDESARKKT